MFAFLNLFPCPVLAAVVHKDFSTPLWVGSAAVVAYVGVCFFLYTVQTKLIYRPLAQIIKTPADIGLAYEDIWIPVGGSKDSTGKVGKEPGEYLHAWWLPNPHSRRVMLFCHGNYGNISYNTDRIRFHYDQGCSVLAFDYRGYGLSSGPAPNEANIFADADAALNYLIAKRGISPENIVVSGHSIGGAVAIDVASHHPEIDRLVVESSFTTMKDAVEAKAIYRFFPIKVLLTEPFDSLSKVKDLPMPVLYVHGDQDFDVPAVFSYQLYTATPSPKQIFTARGADHNMNTLAGDAYASVLQSFYRLNDRATTQHTEELQLAS
ncbi:alpha/beta hydrolase [cf. Phormidesmis sp. LEGE 11477]|uniref:alpha/beta hydrolase n=1 Tax=cf. Phormidesmis sp. LEGE 11477 TaxID=1828680 RepID=UPI001880109E|nr:alpha/beta hydrolase [cf. Phormidesmis sp. LEGE 11477]MBE9062037.1 alpha/beta hydrolase [cf. Phormidesmis sp. LEGE 11477]